MGEARRDGVGRKTHARAVQRLLDAGAIASLTALAMLEVFGESHHIAVAFFGGWCVCLLADCVRFCVDDYLAEKLGYQCTRCGRHDRADDLHAVFTHGIEDQVRKS